MKIARRLWLVLALIAVGSLLGAAYMLGPQPLQPIPENTLASHQRIIIEEASDFTVPGAGSGCECVTRGSGSYLDPFIISGWRVNASDGEGIWISSTTVHFLVQNVVVNVSRQYSGILLRWVQNGAIMDSSISGALDAIGLYRSSSILIANNTLTRNGFGIVLEGSDNNMVTDNKVDGSGQVGIFVRGSNNTVDANLVVNGFFGGINVDGTALSGNNNTVTKNIVEANAAYGIALWHAGNNVISGNVVSENGGAGIMLLDSSAGNLVENNHVSSNGSDGVVIAEQSSGNRVARNDVTGNGNGVTTFDLHDDEGSDNLWLSNTFDTRSPDTIS